VMQFLVYHLIAMRMWASKIEHPPEHAKTPSNLYFFLTIMVVVSVAAAGVSKIAPRLVMVVVKLIGITMNLILYHRA
jgi:hypothetical protein